MVIISWYMNFCLVWFFGTWHNGGIMKIAEHITSNRWCPAETDFKIFKIEYVEGSLFSYSIINVVRSSNISLLVL